MHGKAYANELDWYTEDYRPPSPSKGLFVTARDFEPTVVDKARSREELASSHEKQQKWSQAAAMHEEASRMYEEAAADAIKKGGGVEAGSMLRLLASMEKDNVARIRSETDFIKKKGQRHLSEQFGWWSGDTLWFPETIKPVKHEATRTESTPSIESKNYSESQAKHHKGEDHKVHCCFSKRKSVPDTSKKPRDAAALLECSRARQLIEYVRKLEGSRDEVYRINSKLQSRLARYKEKMAKLQARLAVLEGSSSPMEGSTNASQESSGVQKTQ